MSVSMRQKDLRPAPALIEFKGMKFLITDRPSDVTIHNYIMELKKNNVTIVVRVCEPSYCTDELEQQGITVKDLAFEDGTFPPQQVVDQWFEILKHNYYDASSSSSFFNCCKRKPIPKTTTLETSTDVPTDSNGVRTIVKSTTYRYNQNPEACIAVHCVAGLGRAPVLVALALIELGLKYEAAVEMIRDKRRGAINAKQLSFLERYKPKSRLKNKNGHKNSCCVQ